MQVGRLMRNPLLIMRLFTFKYSTCKYTVQRDTESQIQARDRTLMALLFYGDVN